MPSDLSPQHRGRTRAIRPLPYPSPKAQAEAQTNTHAGGGGGGRPLGSPSQPIAIPPPSASRPISPRLRVFKSASKYGLFRNIVPAPEQQASNNDTAAPLRGGRRVRQMAQELELRVIQGRSSHGQYTAVPTRAPSALSTDSHSSVPFPAPSDGKKGKQKQVDAFPTSSSSSHRPRKDATFGHNDSIRKDAAEHDEYDEQEDDYDYPLVAHLFQDYACISDSAECPTDEHVKTSNEPRVSPRKRNKESWHHTWSREVRRKFDNVSAHRSIKSKHTIVHHAVSDGSHRVEHHQRRREQRRHQRHHRHPSRTPKNDGSDGPLSSWQPVLPTALPENRSHTYGAHFGQVFGNAGGGKGSLFPSATVQSHTARTLRGTPDMSVYLDRTYGLPGKTPTREAIALQNALYNHLAREEGTGGNGPDAAVDRIKHWEAHARRHTIDAIPCASDMRNDDDDAPVRTPRRRGGSARPSTSSAAHTPHVDDFLEVYTPGPLYQKTPMHHVPATASRLAQTPMPLQASCAADDLSTDSDDEYGDEVVRLQIERTAQGSSRIQSLYPGRTGAHGHPLNLHHPDATVSEAVLAAAAAASAKRREHAHRRQERACEGADDSLDSCSSASDDSKQRRRRRVYASDDVPPTPGRHSEDSDSDEEPPAAGVTVGAGATRNDATQQASKVEQSEDGWWYRQDRGRRRHTEGPTPHTALFAPEDCSTDSGDEDICAPLLSPPREVLEESIARCQDWMARSPPAAEKTLPLFQPGWVTPEPLTEVIGHGSRFEEMWREAAQQASGGGRKRASTTAGPPAPTPEQVSRSAEFPRSVTQESTASSRSAKIQIGDTSYEELWVAISRLIADSVASAGQQLQSARASSTALAASSTAGTNRDGDDLALPSRSRAPFAPTLVEVCANKEEGEGDDEGCKECDEAPKKITLGQASKSSMSAPQVTLTSPAPAMGKYGWQAGEGNENMPPPPPVVTVTCEDDERMELASSAGERRARRWGRYSPSSSGVSSLVRRSAHMTLRPMRSDVSMRSASSVGMGAQTRSRPARTAL